VSRKVIPVPAKMRPATSKERGRRPSNTSKVKIKGGVKIIGRVEEKN
jgi:hypothetical protein